MSERDQLERRLLARREIDHESGCWLWRGYVDTAGYGIIGVGGHRTDRVHRVAHRLWIGPIPDGFTVDHVLAWGCTHRNCFNPAHLEAVTQTENTARRPVHGQSLKTHCVHGHEFTEANTNTGRGKRECRTCRTDQSRKAAAMKKSRNPDDRPWVCPCGKRYVNERGLRRHRSVFCTEIEG